MRWLALTACLVCLAPAASSQPRQTEAASGAGPTAWQGRRSEADLPEPAQQAIRRGIAYLVRTQNPDGSWLSDGATGRFPVAMTSLAGLALLANGNTAYSGEHAAAVRRAVEHLLSRADPETGLIGSDEAGRPMFGHGYAMLFLAQVYGSEASPTLQRRIRQVLEGAIRLSASAQSDKGGWYYTPTSTSDEGAVTITQMQGLRACADAGLSVPQQTVERAMNYLRAAVNPDGGIAYRAGVPGDSRPPITAAAVATMYAAGMYSGPMVENAFEYARRNLPLAAPTPQGGSHYYYAHLYLSQVMYFRGGSDWEQYFPAVRSWLVAAQGSDGSWEGDYIGKVYGTSVALLVLQLPYNSLPALQP